MLKEPVLLQDSRGGLRRCQRVAGLTAAGQDGGLGEVREGQCVHGRLLRAECRRDRGVQLWAPHDGHERHRRRPQLLRVVLHGRPTATEVELPAPGEWLCCGYGQRRGGDRRPGRTEESSDLRWLFGSFQRNRDESASARTMKLKDSCNNEFPMGVFCKDWKDVGAISDNFKAK